MNFAVIAPTKYLKDFCLIDENKYHMILAHRALRDNVYAAFYKSLPPEHFKILDNSACELKKSINSEDLLRAYELVKPNVLVLPDTLSDSARTISASFKFLDSFYGRIDVDFMGVVQGNTRKDWLNCFSLMNKDERISYLGVSSTKPFFSGSKFPRVKTIEYLVKRGLLSDNKKIHLLGLGDSGHMELNLLKKYSFIEGCDSSAPIVHGANMIQFSYSNAYRKIQGYLDPLCSLSQRQKDMCTKNTKLIYSILG